MLYVTDERKHGYENQKSYKAKSRDDRKRGHTLVVAAVDDDKSILQYYHRNDCVEKRNQSQLFAEQIAALAFVYSENRHNDTISRIRRDGN